MSFVSGSYSVLGVKVEAEVRNNDDLVEHQSAGNQEHKSSELKPVEILAIAIQRYNQEKHPDE